jgi:hypothetical protein
LKQILESAIQVWHRIWATKTSTKPTPRLAPEFELVANAIDDNWDLKITTGEFAGVLFRFGQVRFLPDDHSMTIKYDYDIIDSGGLDMAALTSPEFKYTLHHILEQLLEEEAHGEN